MRRSRGGALQRPASKMEEAKCALRHALAAVRPLLSPEELRRVAAEWTTPVKVVVKVLEVQPGVGSICSSRLGICLLPEARLPVGEKLSADLLRAPPGLAWSFWAEGYERMEDGWTLESSAKTHRGAREAPQPSLVQRNDERASRGGRTRRANPRAA